MILSLEESVAQQKKKSFRPIFISTMIALTILYIAFGSSGYLSFGPHTQQIITLNLPHGNASFDFAAIVKICLGVSFFFTYPMMLFPVTHLLDKTFGFQNDKIKGNLVRLVIVLLTGIIVSAIPSFAVLASLIGATCCTLLAFIMPAAFHIAIFKNRLTKRQYNFDVLLIVLGVFGTVVGLWDTLDRITEQPHQVDELAQDHSTGMPLSLQENFAHNFSLPLESQIGKLNDSLSMSVNITKGMEIKVPHVRNNRSNHLVNNLSHSEKLYTFSNNSTSVGKNNTLLNLNNSSSYTLDTKFRKEPVVKKTTLK